MNVLFFHSKVLEVERLSVLQFKCGGHVLEADLVEDIAEVPGGQRLFLVFLLGEEDPAGFGILNIRVDLVRIIRISAVERQVAGDAAHIILDEGKGEMTKSTSEEGGWEGGDYLRNGPLNLSDGVDVWLFERMFDVRCNEFRLH